MASPPLSPLRRCTTGSSSESRQAPARTVERGPPTLATRLPVFVLSWFRRPLPVWYHPDYRLPLPSIQARTAAEPRRADLVAWHLDSTGVLAVAKLRVPTPIAWEDLARVHTDRWLTALSEPETLAQVFGVAVAEARVDELMRTTRLACGGTLAASREALARKGPTLNLLGGFHHAASDHGAGFCPVNDMAVALAALRAEGFRGTVAVLDLDAHPPDGTARCGMDAWIGSLSGSRWDLPPEVHETTIPGADDATYLAALDVMLARMPACELVFVIAGGDVLAGDAFGLLRLTLDGAGERDRRVFTALRGVASVWLPGGGYHPSAWKVLARTAHLLATGKLRAVPPDTDPLRVRYADIARTIDPARLNDDDALFTAADIEESLGISTRAHRLLGYYTAAGLEYALFRYGFYAPLRRLGYDDFRVEIATNELGDRFRLYGGEHLLVEMVLARERIGTEDFLFVHWLTLRDPRACFSAGRPQLPSQDVPGLGLAREVGELLLRVATRLGLAGVAFRPMHYHTAYGARHDFQFLEPARQARFEALIAATDGQPLDDVSRAQQAWEPDVMVFRPRA